MATQAKTVQVPLEARAVSGALKVLTEQVPLEARASTEPEATNFYNALLDIIGAGSILEGWRIDETSGDAIGVKGIANMTPGADVIAQGLSTGVDERPVAAQIQVASPGQAFDAGDVNLLDFDFPNDTFSVIVWAKLNGTVASGFFGKQAVLGGAGYQACLRPDVNPDIMQWRIRDGTIIRTAQIQDNAVSDDAWHMWTFINDATLNEIRLHLDNGTPATASHSTIGDGSNSGSLLVGDDLSFRSMGGLINHVYFLSVALSQSQVNQLFAAG